MSRLPQRLVRTTFVGAHGRSTRRILKRLRTTPLSIEQIHVLLRWARGLPPTPFSLAAADILDLRHMALVERRHYLRQLSRCLAAGDLVGARAAQEMIFSLTEIGG